MFKRINIDDKNYPSVLLELSDVPKQLYVIGELNSIDFSHALAIVGARNMTNYGQRVLDILMPEFVMNKIPIVSGFMYGVDTYAHTQTIDNNGRTIAILGSGINSIYPKENTKLINKIVSFGGAVISEYEPDQKPKPWMFARRNRIIAALACKGTLVIEASKKSGSLLTAQHALRLNRNVYSVPGPITSRMSEGTNMLIQSGKAKLVLSMSDIIDTPNSLKITKNEANKLDNRKADLLNLLESLPLTIDEIAVQINKNVHEILSDISELQLSGHIKEYRGKFIKK